MDSRAGAVALPAGRAPRFAARDDVRFWYRVRFAMAAEG
jgi:hypothetical protein